MKTKVWEKFHTFKIYLKKLLWGKFGHIENMYVLSIMNGINTDNIEIGQFIRGYYRSGTVSGQVIGIFKSYLLIQEYTYQFGDMIRLTTTLKVNRDRIKKISADIQSLK